MESEEGKPQSQALSIKHSGHVSSRVEKGPQSWIQPTRLILQCEQDREEDITEDVM